jgi:hypothetical protein
MPTSIAETCITCCSVALYWQCAMGIAGIFKWVVGIVRLIANQV